MTVSKAATVIPKISVGSTMLSKISLGTTVLWSASGGASILRDDFNRADSSDTNPNGLGVNWTNRSDAGNDHYAQIFQNSLRMGDPSGEYAVNSPMIDDHVYNAGTHAVDGYLETVPLTTGEGGTDHMTVAWRRADTNITNGVGIGFASSLVGLVGRVAGNDTLFQMGNFQAGDKFRLVQVGNLHTLLKNGVTLGTPLNDTGPTYRKGVGYDRMGATVCMSKPTIFGWPGSINYSPRLDYIECG